MKAELLRVATQMYVNTANIRTYRSYSKYMDVNVGGYAAVSFTLPNRNTFGSNLESDRRPALVTPRKPIF